MKLIAKNLLKRCERIKGRQFQLDLLIEECAELIQALNKYKRFSYNLDKIICIAKERTHVLMSIQQLDSIMEDTYSDYLKICDSEFESKLVSITQIMDFEEEQQKKREDLFTWSDLFDASINIPRQPSLTIEDWKNQLIEKVLEIQKREKHQDIMGKDPMKPGDWSK
jgi:hypothetical protein